MTLNPDAESFFATRSARDEAGTALIEAIKPLGDYEVRGDLRIYKAPYAVTRDVVFCGAVDMGDTYWRLSPQDLAIAFASGAQSTILGPAWARIPLFRPGWPKPDLAHWARRAYAFARDGAHSKPVRIAEPGPHDADRICVHLDNDGTATTYEATQQFWEKLGKGVLWQLGRGHLVTCTEFAGDWGTWEIHPAGEEIVMLLSGKVEFVLSQGNEEQRIVLDTPRNFVIVPRGTWHTANVIAPARMLFITAGEGTLHKARG